MSFESLAPGTAVLIGSALIHAEELLGSVIALEGPAKFDAAALRTCLESPQVQRWLESFPPGLLPEKR
jgi:hypothetical protein